MRVSKEPEVRKLEILDSAMKVFARKGYEASTMKDIAKEAEVVPGLCYHYFHNKHQLYLEALSQYARECSRDFVVVFKQMDQSIGECLSSLEQLSRNQQSNFKYKDFFDKEGNELFHKELDLYMSNEIYPHMEAYLYALAERGEIHTTNIRLLARFLWGGQIAAINEESLPFQERIEFIKEMILKLI